MTKGTGVLVLFVNNNAGVLSPAFATMAQLVGQLICNQQVIGSIPIGGFCGKGAQISTNPQVKYCPVVCGPTQKEWAFREMHSAYFGNGSGTWSSGYAVLCELLGNKLPSFLL